MKRSTKIHRECKKDCSFHNRIIDFEVDLQIPFQVSHNKLKEIHLEEVTKRHTTCKRSSTVALSTRKIINLRHQAHEAPCVNASGFDGLSIWKSTC